ncbi:MAG: hypothetical protein CVU39_06555 [Chloroflexi bacterium HGW-Chloroflexi-10]|nr:MAG: hypothetical protein CVU39_06555 [Chloroflexi bacterium HGW-Chloroflexi-10]
MNWLQGLIDLIRTISDILTAGIAITAFSLFLYAMTFNLRDRVARSFASILICVIIVFTAEALGGVASLPQDIEIWLRIEWLGVVLLPPTYLHFSDALLETTGRPSRWKRRWAVRMVYAFSLLLLILIPGNLLVGPLDMAAQPAPHLQRTILTELFTVYYSIIMLLAWINFARSYIRTVTPASRRRMGYLVIGALAPALGSFPFLLFGSTIAGNFPLAFWTIAMVSNGLVGFLLILMAYAVAFFGVSWSDRVVKTRLLKWLLRGPVTASLTLAVTTMVRRTGLVFGWDLQSFVPIFMVVTVIICEYAITLFAPFGEKWLFYGNDQQDLEMLKTLEDRLLTRNDLLEFLEMILATVMDRLQASGAYLAALSDEGLELVITSGKSSFNDQEVSVELEKIITQNGDLPDLLKRGDDLLIPLFGRDSKPEQPRQILGIMGVNVVDKMGDFDVEQKKSLAILAERAAMALNDRQLQIEIFKSMELLTTRVDYIQRLRARGRYDSEGVLREDELFEKPDLSIWVKDALTHYWGGPKFTENPLMDLQVVQAATIRHEGNRANALRSILREAIEVVKPEGERRFTAEWILYNILEMKFLEGRKVREIALRLSMSEADLYRKQRVAIEAVAEAVMEMEHETHAHASSTLPIQK